MNTIKSLCAVVLLCCSVSYTRANTILTDPGPGPGANVGGGSGGNAGFDFAVGSAPLSITALGLWDENGDGFSSEHVIGLWDNSGNLLAKAVMQIGTGDPLIGEFRYAAVLIPTVPGPVILSAGTTYVLGAAFLDLDPDHFKLNLSGDQATFDPAVTAGNARISSGGFAFPDENFGPGSFVGPNAQFTVVPEPETAVLLVLGLVLGGFLFVRRRLAAASH